MTLAVKVALNPNTTNTMNCFSLITAEPHSSVGSLADLRTGHWFDPRLDHNSLTTVHCFDNGFVGKQPLAWKEYCAEYWLKELQESMDRCSGGCDITEILLKTPLNTIRSIYLNTDHRLIDCIMGK